MLLVLPRITLWQAAYIGALKVGAIVVPCTAMLREKDLVYRANHSGARAIIAAAGERDMVGDLRSQCPTLAHYLMVGSRAQRMDESSGGDDEGVGEVRRSRDARERSRDLLLHLRHDQGTQGRAA